MKAEFHFEWVPADPGDHLHYSSRNLVSSQSGTVLSEAHGISLVFGQSLSSQICVIQPYIDFVFHLTMTCDFAYLFKLYAD